MLDTVTDRRILVVILAVLLAVVFIGFSGFFNEENAGNIIGGNGKEYGVATKVYVLPCSSQGIRELVKRASTLAGLEYSEARPGQPLPPKSIIVIDYRGCLNKLEDSASLMVQVLKNNGSAIIVGTPVEVSRFVKSQKDLSMFFPLPNTNNTILYALHVRRLVKPENYNGTIAIVDASYMLEVSASSLAKLIRLIYSEWLYATTTRTPIATIGSSP